MGGIEELNVEDGEIEEGSQFVVTYGCTKLGSRLSRSLISLSHEGVKHGRKEIGMEMLQRENREHTIYF